MSGENILVAGIGNIFLGDDGFGVEVVQQLRSWSHPDNVLVADFGIRGFDLAYALMEDLELGILVDAMPHGDAPGTVTLLEADPSSVGEAAVEGHAMHPVAVFNLVKALGGRLPRVLIVGCEPFSLEEGMGLSDPVRAAVDDAVRMVKDLVSKEVNAWVG
jgi:hydrogenase maturation protease